MSHARRLGCRSFNALYGNRVDGIDPADQDELGPVMHRMGIELGNRLAKVLTA